MSWYKMNDLQVHLNDNLIFLEDYWDTNAETTMQNSFTKAYAAFRLESSVKNDEGKTATATDLYYTKDQFRSLIKDSRTIGVNIVPEIDVPAHALAFTKTFQNCALKKMNSSNWKRPLTDHLDLSKPESTQLAKISSPIILMEKILFSMNRQPYISVRMSTKTMQPCTAIL